jgi:hypothetical protein
MRTPSSLLLPGLFLSLLLIGCTTRDDDDDTAGEDLPEIVHDAIASAVEVTEVPIVAEAYPPAESEDAFTLVVTLYYRVAGEGSYINVSMEPTDTADEFAATIPAEAVTTADVEYYLSALWGADLATHPAGAPDGVHRIEVGAAPLAEPEPLRARYDVGTDTVELTWTPPASSAFAGYTVDAQIGAEEPAVVCDGGEADSGCSVPAAGVYDVQYATWTITVTDGDGNGASASAVTDGLHLLQDIWVKEHLPEELASGTGELEFSLPFGVAVRDGSVHVAEQGNHRLQTITDEGDFLGFVGAFGGGTGQPGDGDGAFNAAMDVTVGPDGLLYAADHSNARVQVFDGVTRQFQFSFGTLGMAEGQLRFPTGLAFDGDDNLHVAESVNARVSVFDVDGNFLHSYDTVDGVALEFPARIAWWAELDAMVISDDRTLRLHALGEGGADATWDLLDGFVGTTTLGGVCITEWGEAIVAVDDPEQTGPSDGHVLLKVDTDGVAFDSLGSWGIGDEHFWRPVACAVDEHGDVYVADGLNHRIKLLGP